MRKNTIVTLAIFTFVLGCLVGCSAQEKSTLSTGRYEMENSSDAILPYVQIDNNYQFQFSFSPLSSYLPVGDYTIDNDILTLSTDDGKYTYVFKIDKETLIFQKAQSSEIQVFEGEPTVEDGAIFAYKGDS